MIFQFKASGRIAISRLMLAAGPLFFVSAAAMAESQLQASANTVVTRINEQNLGNGLFTSRAMTYRLGPGPQTVTVRYDRLFNLNADEHDVLRSAGVTVTFNAEDNQKYRLDWLNEPKGYEAARQYARRPTLVIYNSQGDVVVSQQAEPDSRPGLGSLLGKAAGISKVVYKSPAAIAPAVMPTVVAPAVPVTAVAVTTSTVTASPAVRGPASVTVPAPASQTRPVAAATSVTVVTPAQTVTQTENVRLSVVQQLWQQATPEERKQIARWVLSQGQF